MPMLTSSGDLSNIRRILFIAINQSAGEMVPPWSFPLFTALVKWLPTKSDWIILILTKDAQHTTQCYYSLFASFTQLRKAVTVDFPLW